METKVNTEEMSPQNIENKQTLEWQNRLLPIMKKMIIFLTLFFFLASFGQLIYLQVSINRSPSINMNQPLALLQPANSTTPGDRQSIAKLEALILLETNTIELRHHQGKVLLMSSIWVRYLGFVTGMILAMIGSVFILGKLEQNEATEIAGKTAQGEISLKSSSPGIILIVLGATLMIVTIAMQHSIQVNDAPVYLSEDNSSPKLNVKPQLILPNDSLTEVQQPLTNSSKSGHNIDSLPATAQDKNVQVKPKIMIPTVPNSGTVNAMPNKK